MKRERFQHVSPVLIFFMIFLVVNLSACSYKVDRQTRDAENKFRTGNYESARNIYLQIAENNPKSRQAPEAYFWAGQISYLYLKEPWKALDDFHRVITEYPASSYVLPSRVYLAEMYEKEFNEPRLAIGEYQKLIDGTPDHAREDEYLYKIGEVFFNQGDYTQSRNEWEEVVRKHPSGKWADKAAFHLAMNDVIQEKYGEGIKGLEAYIDKYPSSEFLPEARYERAVCLEALTRYAEALQAYKEILPEYKNRPVIENRIKKVEHKMAKLAPPSEPIKPTTHIRE